MQLLFKHYLFYFVSWLSYFRPFSPCYIFFEWKKCIMKKCIMQECELKRVQHETRKIYENNGTWKRLNRMENNTKKAQHENSTLWEKLNTKKKDDREWVQYEKREASKNCDRGKVRQHKAFAIWQESIIKRMQPKKECDTNKLQHKKVQCDRVKNIKCIYKQIWTLRWQTVIYWFKLGSVF